MLKYHLDIYWSEADNAFIAVVPELPSCMADGATYEEVIKNIQIVIEEWIEIAKEFDRPIPQPVYGIISERAACLWHRKAARVRDRGLLVEDKNYSLLQDIVKK